MSRPGKRVSMRCFLAAELNDPVRDALSRVQERLRKTGARVSWTHAENLHLTLFFLGDVTPSRLERVHRSLDDALGAFPGFDMRVSGVGTFGRPHAPRIVWAGVENPPPVLMELQATAADRLADLDFEKETRPYRPHITIGRVRGRERVSELTTELDKATSSDFGMVHVERVVVMQSHLHPQGPRYEVLHAIALKGA